jgi:hypothetical protein
MTRLRYSILFVSVALFSIALGIALGGGLLQGPVQGTLRSQVDVTGDAGPDPAALARRNQALASAARYDRGFAQAMAPNLLEGRLTDRAVAVLALPGVPSRVTKAVAGDIAAAGGTVTTSLSMGRELVDPTARPLVDELSRRLLADLDDVQVPADASAYTSAGLVAARALLTTDDGGTAIDDTASSIFNTLTTAKLLRGAEPEQRAGAAVVLVPEAQRRTPASGGRSVILTDLVTAFDEASDGVVVAGPASAARPRGLLSAVRTMAPAAEEISTVDAADTRAGQLVTVLALAEQVAGTTGHYGSARGADALMPPGVLDQ